MIAIAVFVLAGVGAGLLYAFSGFNDPKQTSTLANNPRIQNLKYAGSVLPTALVADFGKLGPVDATIPLTAYYMGTTLLVALIAIGSTAISFSVSNGRLARSDPRYGSVRARDLVWIYLHYGFAAYRQGKEQALAEGQAKIMPAHEALWNFNGLLLGEKRYLKSRDETVREIVVNEILKAMSTHAKAFLGHVPGARFAANYMIPVAAAQITPDHRRLLRFNDGDGGYTHLLVLMSYEDGSIAAPKIALPIRETGASHYILPGAPEAFIRQQPTSMTRNVAFPAGIPKDIQKQMREYLKAAKFESFICLPLIHDKQSVGIVNIDSLGADAFASQEHTEELVQALQPHCTLLASICSAGAHK